MKLIYLIHLTWVLFKGLTKTTPKERGVKTDINENLKCD